MKLTTAGESHGKALVAIIEGLPARLAIDENEINEELALRQKGFGRSARQTIECDRAEILSGVRDGKTLGSPVTLCVFNRDYENCKNYMSAGKIDGAQKAAHAVTRVRPAHADLAGMIKFGTDDARDVFERASARETAVRVAAGAVFKAYLRKFGVEIGGRVVEVCGVKDGGTVAFAELFRAKEAPLGMIDKEQERCAEEKVTSLKKAGDTAGGTVEIRVKGLKSGFGSPMVYADKLDARLAGALMSIQAAKGVEFGDGFALAGKSGSRAHDGIVYKNGAFRRTSNRAGGIEGGMSNGEEIVVRVAMKPIPTLERGLETVDFNTKERVSAANERSDVCAIFAFERIAEAVVAEVLANAVSERLGGDTIEQAKERWNRLA